MKKAVVLEALDSLDDEFEAEEFIERIFFIEKIEKGLLDAKEGRVISYEEAKRRFADR
ncbi:hypothetical protein [Mucilaginibacter pedocola]|uniref:hypothetical protein n=1 Tax=Mucilaginibacter pedocola TaxID=1792845 RepID=UPI0012DD122E|nr:hypothetical protein [Mucilaginibacter pedocola]